LVSKSVQSNLAHNGCWLHDFISIIKKNVPYKLTITSGIISRQDIYEIDKTSSSKMITLYSNKGKITDIDKIYRIGDQNLISNLNKENSGNIYWINQKNTLIDTLEKNNEKISKKLHEYKKEAKINKNKITNLDQELINIHNSKLWKLFLIYKSLSKLKINIKHKKELDDSFIKYIPGKFKKNKVLGICHDDWYGVKNATLNQCSDVITIHNFDENTSNKIIAYIKKNKIKKVSINAIIDNMGYFVTLLKKQLPEVKIYFIWHGSFTQQTIEDHISRFNSLYPYFDKIYKFGFVKNGMADIFKKLGINKAEFIPNRINDPVIKNNRKPNNKPRIGILANFPKILLSCSFWDENIDGSSAVITIKPPIVPTYADVINESIATLSPTCFINVILLKPDKDEAAETSKATFSFVENSKFISASLPILLKVSPISDDGVPGYAAANLPPPSINPLTIASFPNRKSFFPGSSTTISSIFITPPFYFMVLSEEESQNPLYLLFLHK